MRGRMPQGPEAVDPLAGSPKAKERLRVILETLAGRLRVGAACLRLGICEQRFRQLRAEVLQAALASLEDQPAGRPRRPEEPAEVVALRQQLTALAEELQVTQVREEIALALPQRAGAKASQTAAPAQGKKRHRRH